jgi:hypothetical protein
MEDPNLERELKQIAFHGRSGLIGGTPSGARNIPLKEDVEKGSIKGSDTSRSSRDWEPDEADKPVQLTYEDGSKARNRRRMLQSGGLCLLLVGLVTFLSVYLTGGDDSPSSSLAATGSLLTERQQAIQDIIVRITERRVLEDETTPQYRARQWLFFGDSDEIEIEEARIIQRFALGTIFFATDGEDSWTDPYNWLQGNECDGDFWYGLSCNPQGQVRAILFGKSISKRIILSYITKYSPNVLSTYRR